MNETGKNKINIEKLIRFFRDLASGRPKKPQPDFSGPDQTEEEYRKEQAEWLEAVGKRKERREK